MAVDQVQNNTTLTQNTDYNYSNGILQTAKNLGISLDDMYIRDSEGNIIGIDMLKFRQAVKELKEGKYLASNEAEHDTFVKGAANTSDPVEQVKKANNYRNEISSDYKDASNKYKKYMSFDTTKTEEEAELAGMWNDVKESQFRLTKTGTSNQTVIEGLSAFISDLTKAVNASKNYENSKETAEFKETAFSLETEQDVYDVKNHIEVYEDNLFTNNPFMKSAFETFDNEDEEVAV